MIEDAVLDVVPIPTASSAKAVMSSQRARQEREFLGQAVLMALDRQARGGAAAAMVDAISHRVLAAEAARRHNQRRSQGLATLKMGVGAILGDLLVAWTSAKGPLPVWRSLKAELFARTPVGRRTFQTIINVLTAEHLVHHKRGGHPPRTAQFGMGQAEGKGKSSRFWPTEALMDIAAAHGLTPATMKAAFPRCWQEGVIPPPPKTTLISFEPLAEKPGRKPSVPTVAVGPFVAVAQHAAATRPNRATSFLAVKAELEAEVDAHNRLAAAYQVTLTSGERCQPPSWWRQFQSSWLLQGRWYARGPSYDPAYDIPVSYMSLPRALRRGLLINREATKEIDIGASHLTLLLGRLNLPLPVEDPYTISDRPRSLVKQWIVETLGKGRPTRRGSATLKSLAQEAACSIQDVGRDILRHYPCLEDPGRVVPVALTTELGWEARHLVTHYLSGLEAHAITVAMAALRAQQILALPVHDCLIVPASAEVKARDALTAAYQAICGLKPRLA